MSAYLGVLRSISKAYGMNYGAESLQRYHSVGSLIAQCPVLMSCDLLTTFRTQNLSLKRCWTVPKRRLENVLAASACGAQEFAWRSACPVVVKILESTSQVLGMWNGFLPQV